MPAKVEALRSKAKRLGARGWLAESQPVRSTLAQSVAGRGSACILNTCESLSWRLSSLSSVLLDRFDAFGCFADVVVPGPGAGFSSRQAVPVLDETVSVRLPD
ncbi:hypothetical protein AB0N16_03305 [Streptomyces sp. NPDC051105]|uniref:hypothetical protein n=1 Tax=Streptomyces sp. NPDC051105 TaxID=3154843 RepID=UPI003445E978